MALVVLGPSCAETDPATAELGPITKTVWVRWLVGVRVHFVAIVTNTGADPIELHDISYEMRAPSGALVESGRVPQSYPKRIGPGQSAVIGRTVTADTAEKTEDVASVAIDFDSRKVAAADNLLTVVSSEYRGADDILQAQVVGEVRNDGWKLYDNIKVAVVMLDVDGQAIGFATAKLPVGALGPGETAQFVTHADLPADQVGDRVHSLLVFASDQ
ncbi:MAG: FxLYD domain-containing protein [Dehalococcoidia bacterium]|nr:FxLYD domain-containing protein [Dehalococcoidia bacterium]